MSSFVDTSEGQMAVAIGVGLVIGAERERRRAESPLLRFAGVRTFTMTALFGAITSHISTSMVAIGAVVLGAVVLLGYRERARVRPGFTTELALVVTYGLGALALSAPRLALGCGLVVAAILAFRARLHAAVGAMLSEEELRDALLLGVAAAVVLPLLPDRPIDSLGVVNPFRLWRLAVAFMALGAVGHLAQRLVGGRFGLAIAGFGSGFVSSSATIASMGARVRADPLLLRPALAGATASTVATFVLLAMLVGAADAHLLGRLAWSLGAGMTTALGYALFQTWRAHSSPTTVERGHAFRFGAALLFAGLVTGMSILATLSQRWGGSAGLLGSTALAGLADAHSAAAAVASLSSAGTLTPRMAELGVLLALTTNTLTKVVLAFGARSGAYARGVVVGLVLVMAATWSTYLLAARG